MKQYLMPSYGEIMKHALTCKAIGAEVCSSVWCEFVLVKVNMNQLGVILYLNMYVCKFEPIQHVFRQKAFCKESILFHSYTLFYSLQRGQGIFIAINYTHVFSGDPEILVTLDHLISIEVEHTKVYPSNTMTHYFKIWFEEGLKEKESSSLTPEETFRKEYRGKLINKIGSNAFIPLFCEGYDSPIAHEIMYLMYQHLRNGELKAEAERQGLWNKYMQIIVNETEKVTERYCHASLQECIEYYNFPDKKVVTRDRCPNCGSRRVTDHFDEFYFGLECLDCGSTWNAPLGKRLYL